MQELLSSAQTHIGKKRKVNEDSFFNDDSLRLYIVADGMGGHKGGDIASSFAIKNFVEAFQEHKTISLKDRMRLSFASAASAVYERSEREEYLKGMGTTLTAVAIGKKAYISHIGDSRVYLFRDNTLNLITKDHSLVFEQVQAGLLSEEEAKTSKLRNIITKAIGYEPKIQADEITLDIKSGDMFLLCTDGLNNMLDNDTILATIKNCRMQRASEHLIDQANAKGGIDNITCLIISVV